MELLYYFLLAMPIVLEPFPISSSSHAFLCEQLINYFYGTTIQIPAYYDYWIHGPIVAIVILFFWQEWLLILKKNNLAVIGSMFIAGVLTEIITVSWYAVFTKIGTSFFPLSLGFLISACLLFSLLFCKKNTKDQRFDNRSGFILGMVQGIALLPGISRFGATFVAARWLHFSPQRAFVFSFLIEVPISIAAFFKGMYQMVDNQNELLNLPVLLVILITMLGTYKGFCLIHAIINLNKLWVFGCYLLMLSMSIFILNFF